MFSNVLETRYDVPRERTKEAIEILKDNARYAGALSTNQDGKEMLNFSDIAFPVARNVHAANSGQVDDTSKHNGDAENTTELSDQNDREDWKKICFVITPIGTEDSAERKHSDTVLKHLLLPVLENQVRIPVHSGH